MIPPIRGTRQGANGPCLATDFAELHIEARIRRLLWQLGTFCCAALPLLLMVCGGVALASDRPYDDAVKRGRAALEGGQYNEALQDFMAALEMVDGGDAESWRMLLAIAVTYDQMGQLGHAAEFHRAFLMRAQKHAALLTPAWGKRVENSKRDVDRIMKRASAIQGFVSVVTQPPGATISVDGRPVGAMGDGVSPFLLFLDPGAHTVSLARSGYKSAERTIKIAAGAIRALDVVLEPGASSSGGPSLQPVDEVLAEPADRTTPLKATEPLTSGEVPSQAGAWTLVGGGGAVLVAGAVLTALAASEHSALQADRDLLLDDPAQYATMSQEARLIASLDWDSRADSVSTMQSASVGLYAAGAAALLGGVLWLWLADDTAPTVTFAPTPGGVLSHASVRF
ncbi:MAG: PEGA domain-containing protein [Myxococcota bacterium]